MSFIAAIALFVMLSSCGNRDEKAHHAGGSASDTLRLMTWTGIFPCADCDGKRMILKVYNEFEDETGDFELTEVFLKIHEDEIRKTQKGKWKKSQKDSLNIIELFSEQDSLLSRWILKTAKTLVLTDSLYHPLDEGHDVLRMKKENAEGNSTVLLYGEFYFDEKNNPAFREAATGDVFPVLKIAAYGDLKRRYDSLKINAPAHFSLFGTIQTRLSMDARTTQQSLIVEEVMKVK
ncbi:MAG: hypothetical protein Fur0041_05470 [Bacteroidia bacterium]